VSYRNGGFEAASTDYRKFLLKATGHYDARNNLALAQMHLGNDLTAEMELLVLRRLNDSYLPAAVNLTVVYERLGLEQKARELAEQAAAAENDIPQAVFNAAWFKDLAGAHKEALELITPVAEKPNASPSVKSYKELLEKVTSGPPFSWQTGVAGAMGAYQQTAGMVRAVVVFTLFSLLVIAIAGRKRGRYALRRKPGFWTFVICVSLYLWYWGLSNPVWLLATAFYAFLMLVISRARASR
jgi:tetratricopeptide (TPR) repeat protein